MKGKLLTVFTAALVSGAALAQDYRDDYGGNAWYDEARVVRVDPIIEDVSEPVSQRECWREPVTYRTADRYYGPRDKTPAVLGGIIGGLVGNQFGHGRGRDAATIAGVALGAAIARDEQRRNGGVYQPGQVVRSSEQRCATRTEYRRSRQVVGYDVTYDYQGQIGHVQTDFRPGDTIRVRVDVQALP